MYETLRCDGCWNSWRREVVRGRKPRICPTCRGIYSLVRSPVKKVSPAVRAGKVEFTDGGRGAIQETNDCTVFALALACEVPYAEAHQYLEKAGRRSRKGIPFSRVLREAGFLILGHQFTIPHPVIHSKGLMTFLRRNPWAKRGTYVLHSTHHVSVLKNGKLIDSFDSSRKIIDGAWRVSKV